MNRLSKFLPHLPLILLSIVGIFLRLYQLPNSIPFADDGGRDVLIAKHINLDPYPGHLAPFAAGDRNRIGNSDLYYLVLGLIYRLGGQTGIIAAFVIANLIMVITGYLLAQKILGRKAGYIVLCYMIFSNWMLRSTHAIWQPFLASPFINLSICLLLIGRETQKNFYYHLSILTAFVGLHFHLSLAPYIFLTSIYITRLFILQSTDRLHKLLNLLLIGFNLVLNADIFLYFSQFGPNYNPTNLGLFLFTNLKYLPQTFYASLLTFFKIIVPISPPHPIIFIVISLLLGLSMLSKPRPKLFIYLYLVLGTTIIFTNLIWKHVPDDYHLYPYSIIFLISLLNGVNRFLNQSKLFFVITTIGITIFGYLNPLYDPFETWGGHTYKNTIQAKTAIINHQISHNHPSFTLLWYIPYMSTTNLTGFNGGLWYLLEQSLNRPLVKISNHVNNYEPIEKNPSLIYLVCSGDFNIPCYQNLHVKAASQVSDPPIEVINVSADIKIYPIPINSTSQSISPVLFR